MKTNKLFIYPLFILMLMNSSVQGYVPNTDFENWAIALNGTDSLIGWSSSNSEILPASPSLYTEMNAFQGDYAVHLSTSHITKFNFSIPGLLTNGSAIFTHGNGQVEYSSGGGTPISYKPTHLKGYYMATASSVGDLPMAKVLLSKYNFVSNKRDTVSYVEYNFATSWIYSSFSITLPDQLPTSTPDSITITFYSSNPNTVGLTNVQADFYLDSLYFPNPITTSLNEKLADEVELELFPNPSQGVFNIKKTQAENVEIEIYNVLGEIVKKVNLEKSQYLVQADMTDFPSGTYFIKSSIGHGKMQKLILIN